MESIKDSFNQKENYPEILLIVAVEDTTTDADAFWDSIPVKSTLPPAALIERIKIPEEFAKFEFFARKYQIMSTPGIYVFGPHSSIISQQWVGSYPLPTDFANYINSLHYGAFEGEEEPNSENKRRKIKISVKNGPIMVSQEFEDNETIRALNLWLESAVGPGNKYTIGHSRKPLPTDEDMLITDAIGHVPAALLKVVDSDPITPNFGPTHGDSCWDRFTSRIFMFLSFVNPFAGEGEQESFWEYQPSTNPNMAQIVMTNMMS